MAIKNCTDLIKTVVFIAKSIIKTKTLFQDFQSEIVYALSFREFECYIVKHRSQITCTILSKIIYCNHKDSF